MKTRLYFYWIQFFPSKASSPRTGSTDLGHDPLPKLVSVVQRCHDVIVTGTVDDVRPYLEGADVFVAALRFASGVQNKVLEAMAMEVPVVTTPVVAAGLCVDGVEPQLVIGTSAEVIAAGLVRLLADAGEPARLVMEVPPCADAHCSWAHSAQKLEELCLTA